MQLKCRTKAAAVLLMLTCCSCYSMLSSQTGSELTHLPKCQTIPLKHALVFFCIWFTSWGKTCNCSKAPAVLHLLCINCFVGRFWSHHEHAP